MAAVLYFYVERGGNQYGPRFHYEVFPFVALFVAANVFRERDFSEKTAASPMALRTAGGERDADAARFLTHAAIERQVIRERMDPTPMAERRGCSRRWC